MQQRMPENTSGKVRLQKFLADAGVAARRAAEDLVLEGRVSVNGHHIDSLPAFVDPQHDDVRVDGHRIRPAPKVYYMLNKPRGTAVGGSESAGRKHAVDLLEGVEARVIPVGRLEDESDGVLIMTNDGELAQRLTHPRYGVEKVFRVEVKGQVKTEDLLKIRKGMWFSDGKSPPAWVEVTYSSREMTILEMRMREALNRQIPRLFARFGYKVKKLTCIRIGRITTKGMRVGEYRPLKADEVKHLYKMAEKAEAEKETETQAAETPVRPPRRGSRPKAASARRKVASGKPKGRAAGLSGPKRGPGERQGRRQKRPG